MAHSLTEFDTAFPNHLNKGLSGRIRDFFIGGGGGGVGPNLFLKGTV